MPARTNLGRLPAAGRHPKVHSYHVLTSTSCFLNSIFFPSPNLHRLASFFPSNILPDHFERLFPFSGPLLLLVTLLLHVM